MKFSTFKNIFFLTFTSFLLVCSRSTFVNQCFIQGGDNCSINYTVYGKSGDMIYSTDFKMNLDNVSVSKKFIGTTSTKDTLNQIFALILKWFYIIIGFASGVLLVVGGIMMIISFGNQEKFNKGKNIFIYTALALVVSILAYPLITLIQWVLQGVVK
ncbi:MAG: hypothetical protein PHF46_03815 [Candidatus Gracilibacteria bacterium]|nr:hypothetical protein [Candidatus Gracilibacteria bacterium]MDD4530750.1 hypothetical protein [Candidatus Gracilibacteria bacterium]